MAEEFRLPHRSYTLANPNQLSLDELAARYGSMNVRATNYGDPLSYDSFVTTYSCVFPSPAGEHLLIGVTRHSKIKLALSKVNESGGPIKLIYFVNTSLKAAVLSSVYITENGSVFIRPTSEDVQQARDREKEREQIELRAEVLRMVYELSDVAVYCGATIPTLVQEGLLYPTTTDVSDFGDFDFRLLSEPEVSPGIRYPNPEPEELVAVTLFNRLLRSQ